MKNKGFWIVIAVLVLIFGGVFLFRGNSDKPGTTETKGTPSNHFVGDNTTGVTLVEYGDFQCVFCAKYYPLVKQVVNKYQTKIGFQFRNLPLPTAHQHAMTSARAAEAAAKQGKFWEMYDMLYQNQETWAASKNASKIFEDYATQLGLNTVQFKNDMASSAVNDIINADISEFRKTGESFSTPTFFLNGKKISPTSVDEFSKLIDAEIAKQAKNAN